MVAELKNVFKPFQFRTFKVENRIVMPPMAIYTPGSEGYVTQKMIDYYSTRAEDGPGYIIVNATVASAPSGSSHPNQTRMTDDSYVEGFSKLVDAIHAHGTKTTLQLHHAGRQRFGMIAGGETLSPSGIPDPVRKDPTRAMTEDDINKVINDFADAARRAQQAGFDGIELHCAHGYLLSGFLSPFQNQRTDQYGGDVWGRTKIVREILAACREAAGDDLLLQVRMNGHDYVNGGNTLDDAKEIAKALVKGGAEVLHVSAGMAPSGHYSFLPEGVPQGQNVYLAEGIKEAVGADVPVITVGAIENLEYAEKVLNDTDIDLVAIGRPLFADPDIVKKSKEGKFDTIRPCLRCSKSAAVWPEDMRCVVNPAVGREKEFASKLEPSGTSKHVLVIGSGPAGLEAARVSSLRGHKVTLMEKENQLGGKIHLAGKPPGKDRLIGRWLDYYRNEMERLPVEVKLNSEATVEKVDQLNPDVVIVATGGSPLIPGPLKNVDTELLVSAEDVLQGKAKVGENVAIIGGSSLGLETALYILNEQERKVLVVEMLHDILLDISHDAELTILDKLVKKDFRFITSTMVTGIEENNGKVDLVIKRYEQEDKLTGFDTAITACGVVPNNLGIELQDKRDNVYLVGDGEAPGDFRKAVHDAANIAITI